MIDWLEAHLGANRVVLALSLARLGDGVGNSVLIVVLPLYVAEIPSRWPLPTSVLVGILISVFGLVNSAVQPLAGAWIDRFGRRKASIVIGLGLMAVCTLAFLGTGSYSSPSGSVARCRWPSPPWSGRRCRRQWSGVDRGDGAGVASSGQNL